jgi:purine-binding chemotaxis protein CheW
MDASPLAIPRQFLTFRLDQEVFAMDIAVVREVLAFKTVTKIPRVPEYIRGVLNLRGNVVPVIDMRLKLGLGRTEQTADTCVVITELAAAGERSVFGALVDSVQEVVDLDPEVVAPPPDIGRRLGGDVVRGLAKRADQLIMIVALERVFTVEELRAHQPAAPQADPAGATLA